MRRRHLILGAFFFLLAGPSAASAAELVKASGPAVYFLEAGKRYVFPNEKIYRTWYGGFDGLRTVSDTDLASYPLGGNVTYRPGERLVKIQSDPKVYAVAGGGRLRWIADEAVARALFGADWSRQVDDLSDAFFFNYTQGEPVVSASSYDREGERAIAGISADLALRNGTPSPVTEVVAVRFGAWSDPAVWGGRAPGAGANVVIPPNVTVIYDAERAPGLNLLDVRGTLRFPGLRPSALAARTIIVRGRLEAGSQEQPISSATPLEIFLTGSDATSDDGLIIDGGVIDLRGAEVGSGAALARPASKGAATLALDASPGWKPGTLVAVAATGADPAQTELRTVATMNGAVATLDAPLAHPHRSEEALRAEVFPLSRPIVIRGVGEGRGSGLRAVNRAGVRLQNVELHGLGRRGVPGMHPLFLDGLSAAAGNAVLGTSVRDSGNGCAVLRQTSGVVFERFVAVNADGHCVVLSDGTETANRFVQAAILNVRPGAPGSSQEIPAGFLIRHPGNTIDESLVVGSAGYGYWFDMPEKAVRNDGKLLRPREAEFGTFSNNEARASAKTGLFVDDLQGKMNYLPPVKATFAGLRALMNGERGFWIRGASMEVSNAYLAENRIGGTFAAFGASFRNSVVIGALDPSAPEVRARYGFTFNDGPISVSEVRFKNFVPSDASPAAAFGFEEKSEELPDARNSYRGVTFENARAWYAPPPDRPGDALAAARDVGAGETVVARTDFFGPSCEDDAVSGVKRCPAVYAPLLVALRDGPSARSISFVNLENAGTWRLDPGLAYDGQYAYVPVAESGSYRIVPPPVSRLMVGYEGTSEPILLRIPAGPAARASSYGEDLPRGNQAGEWSYDAAAGEIVLHMPPVASWDIFL